MNNRKDYECSQKESKELRADYRYENEKIRSKQFLQANSDTDNEVLP